MMNPSSRQAIGTSQSFPLDRTHPENGHVCMAMRRRAICTGARLLTGGSDSLGSLPPPSCAEGSIPSITIVNDRAGLAVRWIHSKRANPIWYQDATWGWKVCVCVCVRARV